MLAMAGSLAGDKNYNNNNSNACKILWHKQQEMVAIYATKNLLHIFGAI